jgi:hypothetical protein
MKAKSRGLICDIFKPHDGDHSAGGLSSRCKEVTLIDANGAFDPNADRPAVKLVRRRIDGQIYVHAEPVDAPSSHMMFGGTFVFSHDSRFGEVVGHRQPIALHDRHEVAQPVQD